MLYRNIHSYKYLSKNISLKNLHSILQDFTKHSLFNIKTILENFYCGVIYEKN